MPFGESMARWIQAADFAWLLPTLARMPLCVGEPLARMRGGLQAAADYDWRSLALRQRYIRQRTFQAMGLIWPEADRRTRTLATVARFVHNSREEWQGCLFDRPVMTRIAARSHVEHLAQLLENQRRGRGQVLVSCHFDSFCLGMVLLGMKGIATHVINTAMIQDPRIHPAVRAFFQAKYRAMEQRMNGKMAYYQTDMDHFYQALQKGETVTLMGDIPGSRSDCFIDFLGKRFQMPLSAWHMALRTQSLLGAFVCFREATGRYRVAVLPPGEIDAKSPVNSLLPVYRFLEQWIRRMPPRWVAADMLPAFGDIR